MLTSSAINTALCYSLFSRITKSADEPPIYPLNAYQVARHLRFGSLIREIRNYLHFRRGPSL